MSELPSEYHRRLPYGDRMSAEPLIGLPFFPFEGDIQVVPLDQPVLPEPPRRGEVGGEACLTCAEPDRNVIWRDDQWHLKAGITPSGLPMVAILEPREHYRLDNLPSELTATLGPVIQRVAAAIRSIDGVARTHFNRWGDGSEHFHLWFLARPLGLMQLRGAMIAAWDDMLPKLPNRRRSKPTPGPSPRHWRNQAVNRSGSPAAETSSLSDPWRARGCRRGGGCRSRGR
jgi:diadenosine tetraphosphate (Ap4A) HIT family hydrolase